MCLHTYICSYIITIAGDRESNGGHKDGNAKTAQFNHPRGICVGPDDSIYVADFGNHCIRKISGKTVSTIAGVPGEDGDLDGAANEALFSCPIDVDIDAQGNIYVVDGNGIRKIDVSGNVTTIVQRGENDTVDGTLEDGQLFGPQSLHIDGRGNILVADEVFLRYIDFSSNSISTITGHEESDLSENNILL